MSIYCQDKINIYCQVIMKWQGGKRLPSMAREKEGNEKSVILLIRSYADKQRNLKFHISYRIWQNEFNRFPFKTCSFFQRKVNNICCF